MMPPRFETRVVDNSVDFRDAIMALLKIEGLRAFVRSHDDDVRKHRAECEVVPDRRSISLKDYLHGLHQKVTMENFAQAMAASAKQGEVCKVEVFAKEEVVAYKF